MLRRSLKWGSRWGSSDAAKMGDTQVAAYMQEKVFPGMLKEGVKGKNAVQGLQKVLDEMKSEGHQVWTKSWSAALSYLPKADKRKKKLSTTQEAAQTLFDACVASGVEPDAQVYSQLLRSQRSYANCRVVFDFMVLDGTLPDEETVLTVLKKCLMYSETARHKAESLMSFLEHEGIDASPLIWNQFLSVYGKAGDLPGVADVFLRMQKSGIDLTAESYFYFLQACANSPNISENFDTAELAVMQCFEQGLPLNRQATAQLMKVYVSHNATKRARRLYKNALDQKQVSSELLIAYSKLLRKEGERKESRTMRAEAKNRYKRTLAACRPALLKKLLEAEKKAVEKRKTKMKTQAAPKKRDVIGDAIKRHLQNNKKMPVAKLQEDTIEDRGSLRTMKRSKTVHGCSMRHHICIVSDFFYPGFGGVEIHIFNLSQCLVKLGHKVVIVTRAYGDRQGIRWITNGVKVYYCPLYAVRLPPGTVTLPTVHGMFPLLRQIFIREKATIVHGHQTTSNMCHEAMFHATTMGIPTVFTDHSLFGFADAASIHINKVLEWSLTNVGQVICVSHTCRENTVLRAKIKPSKVSVIPNATDPDKFKPTPSSGTWGSILQDTPITIVAITRLVYRKGADLLADVIPMICKKHKGVRWVIGGDGPRRLQIEQMVERNNLHRRVELLGEVKHEDVPGVLRRGQVFVNTSLTEAFCIAIIEAAACGHLVVSTRVGGVPEVMPHDMLILAEPDPRSIAACVTQAISQVRSVVPWDHHARIADMYNWNDVTKRTIAVYNKVATASPASLPDRIYMGLSLGRVYGVICAGLTAIDHFIWLFLKFISPADSIEPAVDYPTDL